MIYDHPRKKHLYSLPNIIKKLILDDWEKDHTRLDWCLILSENLDKKFNAVGIKNLWQNEKLLCDKFVKKKRKFCKTFHGTQNFSELRCLLDNLVDFLELSMFVNVSLT